MNHDCKYWMPVWAALLSLSTVLASDQKLTGEQIYQNMCVKCHGPSGEGVADKHDEPLYGDRSLKSLARLIERTMPEDSKQKCTPEEAEKVAAYIYDAFYSPEARARNHPPRIQLSRLTVRQYLNSVADLAGSFRPPTETGPERGLNAQYYNSRNFRGNRKSIERTDRQVYFQFGTESPDLENIAREEFSIRWRGSILPSETGDYEFCVKSENGIRLWVNDEKRPLMDEWVSSGTEPREHKAAIRLLGGRAYHLQLDFFKFKDKTASVNLQWKPPHKAWETIPARYLSPSRASELLVISTPFPPDDSSVGYERGTAVSKSWDQAATQAAIEAAAKIIEKIEELSSCGSKSDNRAGCLKSFARKLVERAFRRPLTAEEEQVFVEAQFERAADLDQAIKRVVLLTLKSPRFLYPELEDGAADDYDIASRLSYGLWDSLPDKALLEAAAQGKLADSNEVAAQARRMLKDPRARAKLRDFFHHWLEMEEGEDVSKDPKAFPDFNEQVLADMRTSLDLFIDEVVWSEKSDYRQLLLADYIYLNDRLAKFFQAEASTGAEFQKISFDPKQRSGVLTHPFLLTTFAYHKSSSPIHRGVFLTRNIVGRTLKPPPQAIQFMDGRFDPSLTMREKVAELTGPAACQTCHSVINPLGFSLENFDAVGRFRTTENKKPIDATSDYTTPDGETVKLTGARDLAQHAASSEQAHRSFVQQLFENVVKQSPAAFGPATLEDLHRSFAASEYNIQKLLVEIVKISALRNVHSKEK